MHIYLDHSATTPLCQEAKAAMRHCCEIFGNPSSSHTPGQQAAAILSAARHDVAKLINAEPESIIFTSGGTEADNLAIAGLAKTHQGGHIITSEIEHPAVYNCCQELAKQGYNITYLPVDKSGRVRPQSLQAALRPDTILVSIMHANNEIGSIQDIPTLCQIAHQAGVLFHTDAVQSVGKIPVDVQAMNVDMLTLSAHKINGPKGAGALYIRPGLEIEPIIYGGGHEKGLRNGTENMPGIAGFGAAARHTAINQENNAAKCRRSRDLLLRKLKTALPELIINGGMQHRLPNNINISLPGLPSEAVLLLLDKYGIALSAGSACSAHHAAPSRILQAIGAPPEVQQSALRISLGPELTDADINYIVECFCLVSRWLRRQNR